MGVELAENGGELVDVIEEVGGEWVGDIEGDVPCAGGSERGFDEAESFEYGRGVFEVAAEVSFDLHDEEAGCGECEYKEGGEGCDFGALVDGGCDVCECVIEFVFEGDASGEGDMFAESESSGHDEEGEEERHDGAGGHHDGEAADGDDLRNE